MEYGRLDRIVTRHDFSYIISPGSCFSRASSEDPDFVKLTWFSLFVKTFFFIYNSAPDIPGERI